MSNNTSPSIGHSVSVSPAPSLLLLPEPTLAKRYSIESLMFPKAESLINVAEMAYQNRKTTKTARPSKQTDSHVSHSKRPRRPHHPPKQKRPSLGDVDRIVRSLVSQRRLQQDAKRWKTRATNDEAFVRQLQINEPCLSAPSRALWATRVGRRAD